MSLFKQIFGMAQGVTVYSITAYNDFEHGVQVCTFSGGDTKLVSNSQYEVK